MKKLTILCLIIFSFQWVNAQDEEPSNNKFVIGGSLNLLSQENTFPFTTFSISSGIGGIFSNTTSETTNSVFSISPYFGKEINPNWLIGVELDFRTANYETETTIFISQPETGIYKRESSQFGVGLFARYMVNPADKVVFFLQPGVEYNSLGEDEFFNGELIGERKVNYIESRVNLGIVYNVNDKVRVLLRSGGLLYVNGKSENETNGDEKDFSSFSANLNLRNTAFGVELRF